MDNSHIGKPILLALAQTEYSVMPWVFTNRVDDRYLPEKWVRLTEIIEVTFPARPQDEWVPDAHKALDAAEKEAYDKLNNTLSEIKDKRAQLLQITHNPDAASNVHLTPQQSVNETLGDANFFDDIPF